MNIKNLPISIKTLLIIVVIVFLIICVFPWVFMGLGFLLSKTPDEKPVAQYGEFPFKLVYEMDGEIKTLEDTLIIEYKGVAISTANGKYNDFEAYLLSQKGTDGNFSTYTENIIFYGTTDENISAKIYFEIGSCEYYMCGGKLSSFYKNYGVTPGDIVVGSRDYNGPISEEELLEKFGIKIIEKSISKPIAR